MSSTKHSCHRVNDPTNQTKCWPHPHGRVLQLHKPAVDKKMWEWIVAYWGSVSPATEHLTPATGWAAPATGRCQTSISCTLPLFSKYTMIYCYCIYITYVTADHCYVQYILIANRGSKRPGLEWLIVVYCSSVNFTTSINATMSLYSINIMHWVWSDCSK